VVLTTLIDIKQVVGDNFDFQQHLALTNSACNTGKLLQCETDLPFSLAIAIQ